MQEAPLLRSAGVITIPSAFDAETPAFIAEDEADGESSATAPFSARGSFCSRPSMEAGLSTHPSMARTEAESDMPATGFAAAIEAVRHPMVLR